MDHDPSKLGVKLLNLAEVDPVGAIEGARRWLLDGTSGSTDENTIGSVLAEAGNTVGDRQAIADAVQLFRRVIESDGDVNAKYNLGNALSYLASLDTTARPEWYLSTTDLRRESRCLFAEVANCTDLTNSMRTQAMTNLGLSLVRCYRWAEAYDAYHHALELDATNGVAAASAASLLYWLADNGLGSAEILRSRGSILAKRAKENLDTVRAYAGEKAAAEIAQLQEYETPGRSDREAVEVKGYEAFISRHRLALVPCLEDDDFSMKRFDDLHIQSVIEGIESGPEPPPLLAMFNVAKADYLLARKLAYEALGPQPSDTGLYFDTLDYAVYGTGPSALLLAQRTALDVLDKLAVALNHWLGVGIQPKDVYFRRFWRRDATTWRETIREEIDAGNPALVALTDLSDDLDKNGYLFPKQALRNSTTHRFAVLHDLGVDGFRPCDEIHHASLDAAGAETIATLQMARASLQHLSEAVAYKTRRQRAQSSELIPVMPIYPHHKIRGED